jgi:hypothetical protein
MIQHLYELGVRGADVVYCDTGWASEAWPARVERCEEYARGIGMRPIRVTAAMPFEELMLHKKGFPSQRYQWCSALLKVIPFLVWLDAQDPQREAVVCVGVRREESAERANTPDRVDRSERHGDRAVWYPLAGHTTADRDALLSRAGFAPLPHRSQECAPCINANRGDFRALSAADIAKAAALEARVGKTMFRPYRPMGAVGVPAVIQWAKSERGKYRADPPSGCDSGMCGT